MFYRVSVHTLPLLGLRYITLYAEDAFYRLGSRSRGSAPGGTGHEGRGRANEGASRGRTRFLRDQLAAGPR